MRKQIRLSGQERNARWLAPLLGAVLIAGSACSSPGGGDAKGGPPSPSSPVTTLNTKEYKKPVGAACSLASGTDVGAAFGVSGVSGTEGKPATSQGRSVHTCVYRGGSLTVALAVTSAPSFGGAQRFVDGSIKGAKGQHQKAVLGIGDSAATFDISSKGALSGIACAKERGSGSIGIVVIAPTDPKASDGVSKVATKVMQNA